jgi:hypothetical protein
MLNHCCGEMVSFGVNSGPLSQDQGSLFEIISVAMSLEIHLGSIVLTVDLVVDTRPCRVVTKSLR